MSIQAPPPPKGNAGALPVFDLATALGRYSGDEALLRKAAARLLTQLDLFDAANPCTGQAPHRLAETMHRLRGAAGMVGAMQVHACATQLEAWALENSRGSCLDSSGPAAAFNRAVADLREVLCPWLSERTEAVSRGEPAGLAAVPVTPREWAALQTCLIEQDLSALELMGSARQRWASTLGTESAELLESLLCELSFGEALQHLQACASAQASVSNPAPKDAR